MEAMEFAKTPGPIIFDENYLMVGKAWKLAIEAKDLQGGISRYPTCLSIAQ